MDEYPFQRRLGAFPLRTGRTEFRVWAPNPDEIVLRVGGRDHALEPGRLRHLRGHGRRRRQATTTSSCSTAGRCRTPVRAGSRTGLRGPSRIVDPLSFEWTDGEFRALGLPDAVIYELHIGTFSPEGTFEGRSRTWTNSPNWA